MMFESTIREWIRNDPLRLAALEQAAALALPDWCLAAGFVRNLVWDKLHDYEQATLLADIDLIYFDPFDLSPERDLDIENRLKAKSGFNWSVKNQARMHIRNDDAAYTNTADAMMHWIEVETAIGVRLIVDGELELIAPFGLSFLENLTITLNQHRPKPIDFSARVAGKQWQKIWPKLRVVGHKLKPGY